MTVSVEFRSVGSGACGWCSKSVDEVFNVSFADKSFVGPLCKNDLLRAIRMKVGNGNGEAKLAPVIPAAMPVK